MFTHDLPYCINFPPRLDRTLLELDRDDTCTVWPQLNSIFNDIQSTTDSKNWTQKPFALVASRVAVSDNGYELSSLSTLFMFLPERFAPKLHELATQTPMADNKRSRKFGPNETLQEWQTTLADGRTYRLGIPDRAIMQVIAGNRGFDDGTVAWIPVAFVAGERIVCGGFWCGFKFLLLTRRASYPCRNNCGNNYCPGTPFNDDELARAAKNTEGFSSSTPWRDDYWANRDGIRSFEMPLLDAALFI